MNLDKSKYQVAGAGAELTQEELNLMVRVSTAYFQILAAEDNLSFARAELRAIARQLDQAKQRFDVGLIAITDVHEVQAAYDRAKADEIEAINLQDSAWEQLREIVADFGERNIYSLRARIPMTKPNPANLDAWIKMAMESNPGLIAAQNALKASRRDIDIARSGHLPTLDLVAGASRTNTSDTGLGYDTEDSSIGLQLNLPIYAGGGVSASTRKARYDFQTSAEQLEQVSRSVRRNVSDYYRGVLSSISQVRALESSTRSAQSALKATEAGFEVGTRTMVDVLAVQRNLYDAQRNFAKARYEYILNGLKLKQAAGVLSVEDLRAVNGLLQGRS